MLLTVYLPYVPKICFSRDGAYEVCMFLSGCLGSETCDNGQTASGVQLGGKVRFRSVMWACRCSRCFSKISF